MITDITEISRKFHDQRYKLTSRRQNIIQVFIEHPDHHLSAEDVYQNVRQHVPDIGLATVYRTLALLSDLDILQKLDFGNGCYCYEINKDSSIRHQHLICLSCGKVLEFQEDLLESLKIAVTQEGKFTVADYRGYFYGYCQECLMQGKGQGDMHRKFTGGSV